MSQNSCWRRGHDTQEANRLTAISRLKGSNGKFSLSAPPDAITEIAFLQYEPSSKEVIPESCPKSPLNIFRCYTSILRARQSRQMQHISVSLTECSLPCWSGRPPCQPSMRWSTASTTSTLMPPPSSLCSRLAAFQSCLLMSLCTQQSQASCR